MLGARPTTTLRAGGTRWRKSARLIYEYLRREMRDAEVERERLYPKTHKSQVQRTIPLIWRMAREMATLYLRAPARTFLGADGQPIGDTSAIESVYRKAKVNRRLRTLQEHLSALQNATLWVWLTSDGFRLLTPPIHNQSAWSNRVDGQEVNDVAEWRIEFPVVMSPNTTVAQTAVALITPTMAVWETGPDGWQGRGIWEPDGKNPFGRIPVVYLRGADPAPGEFFVPVPEDMLDAQRAVNHDFTDQGTIGRKQGFAQGYLEGFTQQQASEVETGPETFVGVPQGSKFGFASPQSSLREYGENTESFVKLVIACSGMSPATVMKSTGITALAKIVENLDREVERQRAKDEFEPGEQDLYDLMQIATRIRSGGLPVLPEGVRVRVEHREPVMPADPINDAQAKTQRVQLALDCAASIISVEKAISIEEAQKIALRNLELEHELGTKRIGKVETDKEPTNNTAQPEAPPALAVAGADVQRQALNGAQVDAMGRIVDAAARRQIPIATARAQILAAFPISEADVEKMLGPLEGFAPAIVAAPAAPGGAA